MESLFAKAWSGCSPQHIPSCKGAFHDVASTTVYRGHAGPELFACNTSLLHPRSLGICPLLQQVPRVVRTGTDSCLSDLPDQRKEAGGSFDQRGHLRASLPLSGDPQKELVKCETRADANAFPQRAIGRMSLSSISIMIFNS